jgi:hypothetical protein
LNTNDPGALRRRLAGLCLVVGPLLLLLASIIEPEGSNENRQQLQNIADSTGAAEWSTTLWVLGFVLVAAGLVGLVAAFRGRGATLANIALIPAFLGVTCLAAISTTTFFDVALVENLSIDQAVHVQKGAEDNIDGFIPILVLALLGTLIGFILLAIALFRSKIVPVFVPVLIVVGLVLLVLSEESKALSIAANAALAAGYCTAGLTLMRGRAGDAAPATGAPPPAV